jgi:hypothetical protein
LIVISNELLNIAAQTTDMIRTSLSVLAAVCCTVVFSQDLQQYELHGPVKSMTEKSFRAELKGKTYVNTMPGWFDETEFDHTARFDEKGRVSSTAFLTEDGSEYQEESFEYNGDKLIHVHSWYNEAEYNYDANGLLTEVISNGHGIGTNQVYVNTNGKPTEVWSISTEGDTISHEMLEMDAKGNFLKSYAVPFASGDFYKSETVYTYDADGHVIQQSYRTDYALTVIDRTYVKGRLTMQTLSSYTEGMLVLSEESLFNKKGFLAEKKKYEMIDPYAVNKLELTQTQTFTYTFDKKGNWTKKVMTVSVPGSEGAEYYVVERGIAYY